MAPVRARRQVSTYGLQGQLLSARIGVLGRFTVSAEASAGVFVDNEVLLVAFRYLVAPRVLKPGGNSP